MVTEKTFAVLSRFTGLALLPAAAIAICQTVAARFCRLFVRLIGGLTVDSTVTFDPCRTYVFAANHQSRIDPFTVFGALSLADNLRIAPVRFITARVIYYSPLWPVLRLMGCYPVQRQKGATTQLAAEYLRTGYSVFIFPEGKRTLHNETSAQPGVSRILQAAPDASLILAHIEWRKLSFGRRRATVRVREASDSIRNESPANIMNAIYEV